MSTKKSSYLPTPPRPPSDPRSRSRRRSATSPPFAESMVAQGRQACTENGGADRILQLGQHLCPGDARVAGLFDKRASHGPHRAPYAARLRPFRDYEARGTIPGNASPRAWPFCQCSAEAAPGHELRRNTKAWREVKASIVPPYDPKKFPNKWRKLEPGKPSCTLTAHLSKDSYSHIHYDGEQARTISVREAARLQSFPDGFIFLAR